MRKDAAYHLEVALDVRAVQAPVLDAARAYFSSREVDHLSCLVRLSVEFFHCQFDSSNPPSADELEYLVDSVLSGVDSFVAVRDAYRLMDDRRVKGVFREGYSMHSLLESFRRGYVEFLHEAEFMKKCGLLLDLFSMQLVFAGSSAN